MSRQTPKVQHGPMHFDVTPHEQYIYMASDFMLQLQAILYISEFLICRFNQPQSKNIGVYILKSSKRRKLILLCSCNYLTGIYIVFTIIYIVLGIISNLEMIWYNIYRTAYVTGKYYVILCRELQHLHFGIHSGPGTNVPWTLKDNSDL